MYAVAMTGVSLHTQIFMPLVTRINSNLLCTVLSCINSDFNYKYASEQSTKNIKRMKYDSLAVGIKWFMILSSLFSMIITSLLIYGILFCNQNCLDDSQFYIFVLPFQDRIHSYKLYFLIQIFTALPIIFLFLGGSSLALFHVLIGCEFYNAYMNLCVHLQLVVDDIVNQLKVGQIDKVTSLQYKYRREFEVKVYRSFEKAFTSTVEQYKMLTR